MSTSHIKLYLIRSRSRTCVSKEVVSPVLPSKYDWNQKQFKKNKIEKGQMKFLNFFDSFCLYGNTK